MGDGIMIFLDADRDLLSKRLTPAQACTQGSCRLPIIVYPAKYTMKRQTHVEMVWQSPIMP